VPSSENIHIKKYTHIYIYQNTKTKNSLFKILNKTGNINEYNPSKMAITKYRHDKYICLTWEKIFFPKRLLGGKDHLKLGVTIWNDQQIS
jgi:hypothetical protein